MTLHDFEQGLPSDFERVPCKLVGEDGNAIAILARVRKALRRAGLRDVATNYQLFALHHSYDELLCASTLVTYDPDEENDWPEEQNAEEDDDTDSFFFREADDEQ